MDKPIGSGASMLMGNPPPTGNEPPAGGASPAPPPAGQPPQEWYGAVDPDLQAWATTKGWKTPGDALTSHRNLEKYLGGEKVPVPKSADDAQGWDIVYKALGRPDAPDGYGLDKIEGFDSDFAKSAADAFHAAGITVAQAAKLTEWHQSIATQTKSAQELAQGAEDQAFVQQSAADIQMLKESWGPAADARFEAAKRAALKFGVDAPMAEKLERALGTKPMFELMAKIGIAMAESPAIGMRRDEVTPFTSPEEARRMVESRKADPAFRARLMARDASALAELESLQKLGVGM